MKRTVIASILGVVACAAVNSSYGQGSIIFVNYGSSASGTYSAPVTLFPGGPVVGSDFSAELLYSSTGTVGTFTPLPASITPFYGTGLGDVADGGGWFVSSSQVITAYGDPATPVAEYFEVYAFNNDVFRGYPIGTLNALSNIVKVNSLADAANLGLPGDLFTDNANVVTPLEPFSIGLDEPPIMPEPTTITLGALCLISLLAFRCSPLKS